MRWIQHPSNNDVLGAPKGWDQSQLPCGAIPITRTDCHGHEMVCTYWMPTAEELAKLNEGQPVVLAVMGTTMPPVGLTVCLAEKS